MQKGREILDNGSVCGMPSELYIRVEGEERKVCPKCHALSNKVRKCLKCEREFKIGCKAKFVCPPCKILNAAILVA